MKSFITFAALIALAFSASANSEVQACKADAGAGAFNSDEKAACIVVAVEKQIEACKANAGAFNSDEKAACIVVAMDNLK
jgi:hypothetical protein